MLQPAVAFLTDFQGLFGHFHAHAVNIIMKSFAPVAVAVEPFHLQKLSEIVIKHFDNAQLDAFHVYGLEKNLFLIIRGQIHAVARETNFRKHIFETHRFLKGRFKRDGPAAADTGQNAQRVFLAVFKVAADHNGVVQHIQFNIHIRFNADKSGEILIRLKLIGEDNFDLRTAAFGNNDNVRYFKGRNSGQSQGAPIGSG